ncbi:SpoIIE family protein phosphatase [Cellulomonas sp. zg-ZUI199]|uniref:SpoIIE family protein phosphatase n=1 Tax=Cellulomonas wangleii TaxID=2816956 RepID=A0ABX8D5W9_9CELL|nr:MULTISPECIES: SpoIIE family protein phosphatase [Cellulomonas]MBO0898777.1 SpoIIE family protein phosphatase [Cellulomonas sp. zg-ZUI22]MBO0923935.1 SpoIIE family protein phosphatase [Cellulomonas wangleii]MBO0924217.1 SpoIIE family protein phosphatase [Cellulomonas wangleii]QVI62230.1 SpoIIE family protein phosphatase [Cellulomonas wangleii]
MTDQGTGPGPLPSAGEALADLDACAEEPIRIPGSVQPHGVLLAVSEPDLVVRHVSANVADLTGRSVDEVVGAPLRDVLGVAAEQAVRVHVRTFGDLRARNPVSVDVAGPHGLVTADAILHRIAIGGRTLLVVELETATGPRPFSFPNTYQAVRAALEKLHGAGTLEELYDVAAQEVRALTGFDRVMVYRFDEDHNGEVVAEARRADLNAFLGLHYPASDIPQQARALYETNWIRLIADVGYRPAPIVPAWDPASGEPLDLTHAVLRSVSPVHVEYLTNMGVRASMSISLLREGRLWGLVACHHYAGPHVVPFGVRAAAEFLGSALSLRLVARAEDRELERELAAQGAMTRVLGLARDPDHGLAEALAGDHGLLAAVPAHGLVVVADGTTVTAGDVPVDVAALRAWVLAQPEPVTVRTQLGVTDPELAGALPDVAGVLAVRLPDDQVIAWLRYEQVRDIYWGGDPHNKAIAHREGDEVRLSPRKSFDQWREVVRGRSEPWAPEHVRAVADLRSGLLEVIITRNRWQMAAAHAVQLSLLPRRLPELPGWSLQARYVPAAGGRVGGDWYDALELPDGRFVVVVGDVAGHGLGAAAAMGQLRNALRAYVMRGAEIREALVDLDELARRTMPDDMATVVVVVVDPATGEAQVGAAGHPRPLVLSADGDAALLPLRVDRPIGVGSGEPPVQRLHIEPGGGLVLYSDGLVDSRSTALADGIDRLIRRFDRPDPTVPVDIDEVVAVCSDPDSKDDMTLLLLCRDADLPPGARP